MRILKWLVPLLVLGFVVGAVLTSYRNWIRTEPRPAPTMDRPQVSLNVLNASGVVNAGRDVRTFLTRMGFDCYGDRNHDEILPRTQVIDRVDPLMSYAREVRNAVLVPGRKLGPFYVARRIEPEIGCRIDSLLFLQATVILGEDYRTFFPVEPSPF